MLYSALSDQAHRSADATAVREHDGTRTSYRRLVELVNAQRTGLRDAGVAPGSVVVTQLANSVDYIALLFALASCGAVHCPVSVDAPAVALRQRVVRVGAALVVGKPAAEVSGIAVPVVQPEQLAGHPPKDGPYTRHQGPCRVQETSGSTGEPRLALWHQDALVAEIENWLRVTGTDENDVFYTLHTIDGGHGVDLHVFPALLSGASVALAPTDRPATAADLVKAGATALSALPEQYAALADDPEPLPGLRLPMCGGGYLSDRVARHVADRLGIRLRRIYGSTEFGMILADLVDSVQPDQGMTPPGDVWVRLRPLTGLPPEVGEIEAMSNHCGTGLLGESGGGARPGEWYRTGDVGRMTKFGTFMPLGRVSDAVPGYGETFFAPQLEDLLTVHPDVHEAVALPANGGGTTVVAAPAPGSSLEQARHAIEQVLRTLRIEADAALVERLPRTSTGKPDRRLLRERYVRSAGTTAAEAGQ